MSRPIKFFIILIGLLICFTCYKNTFQSQSLLGTNLEGVKKIVKQLNQKKMQQDPYTMPQTASYAPNDPHREEIIPNECKFGRSIIFFKNRALQVEVTSPYQYGETFPGNIEATGGKVYLYLTTPLTPEATLKLVSDFIPFQLSNAQPTTFSGEGNECTGDSGLIYRQNGYVIVLFYEEGPIQKLVNEVWISLEKK